MALARRLSRLLFRTAGGGGYQPAPKLVLLASGDDDLRADVVRALEQDQHHVVELDDGLELLDYLEGSRHCDIVPLPRPHAIIASLSMPGLSGLGVLEALHRGANRTPFIGLAEPCDAGSFDRAKALGATYIFVSPVRFDDVRAALHSLPGGTFPESKLSQGARLQACERGRSFRHDGEEP